MQEYTKAQLKDLVKKGVAMNITFLDISPFIGKVHAIGYSVGKYGVNGAFLQSLDNQLYVVLKRNSNLFALF